MGHQRQQENDEEPSQEQADEEEGQQAQAASSSIVCISLEVPPGAQPGDVLSFVVGGKELEFELTEGFAVGDILQVQVQQQDDNDDNNDNDRSVLETRPDHHHDDDNSTGQLKKNANGSSAAHQHQFSKKPRIEDIAKNEKDTTEKNAAIMKKTTITLPNGKQLHLDHEVLAALQDDDDNNDNDTLTDFSATRQKEEATSTTTITKAIERDDTSSCDGTHAMAWPAARVLLQQMDELLKFNDILLTSSSPAPTQQKQQRPPCPIRILELGSGLGIVGLGFAASLLHLHKDGGNSDKYSKDDVILTLTDCAAAMPLLQCNVEQNRSVVPPNVTIECKVLDWTNTATTTVSDSSSSSSLDQTDKDESSSSSCCYSLILASDVLYNIEMIPHLISVLDQALDVNNGRVLLAVRWRKPQLERVFFEETTRRLGLTWTNAVVAPASTNISHAPLLLCDLDWRDFGNPASPASNRYLQQTMISIQGSLSSSLKPLATITEQDTAAMTELEYETWERAFIQIFIGTRNSHTGKKMPAVAAAAQATASP